MSEVEAEFLFEARVQLDLPPMEVGDTPSGNIRIFYVKGGTFEGPKLKGTVLPGGADWVTVRPDGSSHLDVRFCLRTDDGALLYLFWVGRFYVEDESDCGRHQITYWGWRCCAHGVSDQVSGVKI